MTITEVENKRTSVLVGTTMPTATAEELRREAERDYRSVAAVVRLAVEKYLAERRRQVDDG